LRVVAERYVLLGVPAFHVDQPARHDHRHLVDAYLAGDGDRVEEGTSSHVCLVEATIRAQLGGLSSPQLPTVADAALRGTGNDQRWWRTTSTSAAHRRTAARGRALRLMTVGACVCVRGRLGT
jgi:hypothetical protein